MRINAQCVCVNQNNNFSAGKYQNRLRYSDALQPDTFTPSFTALKKSAFKGIDFAIVEKFKAPIEKFKSLEDFEKWAEDEYYNICSKYFGGRTGEVKNKRESMICDWENILSKGSFTNAERLLVMDGVTKDLKPKTDTICPVYNSKILKQTLDEIKTDLEKDKKLPFSFNKRYRKNLTDMYTERSNTDGNEPKWIIIPSKDNDPVHFKENVKKLQTISTYELCTKYSGAEFHLENGDMHIYMENGKPKVLLRLNDGMVQEINGEHNDYRIPEDCVELTKKYLYENDLLTTEKADEMLRNSKMSAEPKDIKPTAETAEIKEEKTPNIFQRFLNLFK